MRSLGQFQACSFFFYEKRLSTQKAQEPKTNTNDFHPLKSFCACKNLLPLLFSVHLFLFG